MCFSAAASIAGGVVISGFGVITEKQNLKPEQRLFAGVPFIFALQQFAEGVVWLTLRSSGYTEIQGIATHIFLGIALVVWPSLIPIAMLLMEKSKDRRFVLAGLTAIGAAVSIYNAFSLFHYQVTPQIQSLHIVYIDNFPTTFAIIPIFYVMSTVLPLFVSSVKRMWIMGGMILISLAVTVVFFSEFLTSVWCFFAAILSMMVYWILQGAPVVNKIGSKVTQTTEPVHRQA
jgi:hypothetical protein